MHNIVLDTNVFVSSLMTKDGASREILRRCLQRKLQPLMGEALFAEYEDLASRSHLFADCALNEAERLELLQAFLSVCNWVNIYYLWRPNLRDEADSHLFELAVSGNASLIVTHNLKDLKSGELIFGAIKIVSPKELINLTKGE